MFDHSWKLEQVAQRLMGYLPRVQPKVINLMQTQGQNDAE